MSPVEACRIFCYGDSLTAGARGISYVDPLTALLPAHAQCRARGIPGATASTLERDYGQFASTLARDPDVLILTVGTNEALGTFSPGALRMLRRLRGRPVVIGATEFRATLLRWLGPIAPRLTLVLCGLALASRNADLQLRARELDAVLSEVAAKLGGLFVDMHSLLAPHMEPEAEPYIPFSRLRDSLRSRIENRLGLIARHVDDSAITFDGVHFARRGAELYAQAVRLAIAPALTANNRA